MSWLAAAGSVLGTAADMYTAHRSGERAENLNNSNIAMQREFAQNGIRWRVEDAKAAGLHPLAAVGAMGSSFSPVSAVGDTYYPGKDIASMGQNISRAMSAGMTEEERLKQRLELNLLGAQINESDMRGEYYRAQAFKTFSEGLNQPAIPTLDTPKFGAVKITPDRQISRNPKDASVTAGSHPAFKKYEVYPGFKIYAPYSEDGLAEAMEGMGALGLTLLANGLFRPAQFFNRAGDKALSKYRNSVRMSPHYFKKRDNLVSAPSY